MRTLIFILFILVLATDSLFAQGVAEEREGDQKASDGSTVIQGGITIKPPPMMSNIVQFFLNKANSLDLTETQKKHLSNIREEYLYTMIRNEGDYQISHIKVNEMLQNPDFDPNKVKAEMKVLLEFSLEEVNMAIDALAAMRNVIGVENFKKVMGMMALKSREVHKIATPDDEQESEKNN